MSRPSRNTDRRLLDAGRRLLPETGIAGLSLRKVAAEAGVNLGMFYYHFGSKRKFVRRVLQEIYEEFFKGFSLETLGEAPPIERLGKALTSLARFVRDNRKLFLSIFRGVLEEDPEAVRFVKDNLPRHIAIVAGLVERCQKQGVLRPLPVPSAMAFLAGGAIMPNLALGLIERTAEKTSPGLPFGVTPARLEPLLASDKAIRQRVKAALKGLRRDP